MTKKNIRPQQVAPVQRETTATSKDLIGQVKSCTYCDIETRMCTPFAGDDAE
ncbi:anacyclamide/piricyclamide family prenylated cyclic peptide [Nostoc sp. UHCC 0870]|uniref:anacyclamide/piricyclamide family prenylated cyclic peptide n=1 Tax=Nostoc sp. UHCC 0870 TaxID=2914041 RepID=UPI003FA54421